MSTDLIPLHNPQPSALFVPGGLEWILACIEQDARSIVLDVSTRKGREQIASVAAKVARSKTYLDGLGKEYVAELKRLPAQVDAERKAMRDLLDALRDEIRAPLTAWEAEEERKERETAALERTISAPVLMGTSSDAICDRLSELQIVQMPAGISDAQMERIVVAIETATPMLSQALEAALAAERQAAEVARLQREEQARREREREERIAREAEERGRAQAAAAAERELAVRERRAEMERRIREAEEAAGKAVVTEWTRHPVPDGPLADNLAAGIFRLTEAAQGSPIPAPDCEAIWEIAEDLARGLDAACVLAEAWESGDDIDGEIGTIDTIKAAISDGRMAANRLAKLRLERAGQQALGI